jgi:hypothetical protein
MEATSHNISLPPGTRICKSGRCSSNLKPLGDFAIRKKDSKNGKKGSITDICQVCMTHDTEKKRQQRARVRKERSGEQLHWENMDMESVVQRLAVTHSADIDIHLSLDIADFVADDLSLEECSKAIASMIGDVMCLHWR